MPLSFQRQQAGEYNVLENGKTIAYIQKSNSSKWITYFCTNPAIKGKPQNVAKTLKDSKAFCENNIGAKCSNPSMLGNPIAVQKTLKELKVDAETLITSSQSNASVKPVKEIKTSSMDEDKFDIMREMLNQNYVIDLNEYKQTKDGLEEVPNSFNHFLSEEEIAAL